MTSDQLTSGLREVLTIFENQADPGEPLSTTEVAQEVDISRRGTYARLERLVEKDLLQTKKAGARSRVWWQPVTDERSSGGAGGATSQDGPDVGPRFSRLLDFLPAMVYQRWNEEGLPTSYASDSSVALTGHEPHALTTDRVSFGEDVVHPSDRERVEDEIAETVQEDGEYAIQYRLRTAADEVRWVLDRGYAISTVEEGPTVMEGFEDTDLLEGIITDVTGHIEAQRQDEDRATQLESLVEATEEYAIFMLDPDGRIVTWNSGAGAIKGYEREEILGEHVSTFYTQADSEAGVPERNLDAASEDGVVEDEGWRVRKDGSRFWANVTTTAIRDDDGTLDGFANVTRDMTDKKQRRDERRLQLSVSRSIAEAASLEDGLQAVLREVCELTDWEIGQAWIPSGSQVERLSAVHISSGDFETFEQASREYSFAPGEGIPGRVFESGSAVWLPDVTAVEAEIYPRKTIASAVGLKAGCGVPVVADGEIQVVLEFYMSEYREEDERLVDVVTTVGNDLGGLVKRREAEDERDRERKFLERVMNSAPVGITLHSPTGELLRANDRALEQRDVEDDTRRSTVEETHLYDEDGRPIPDQKRPFATVCRTGEPVEERILRVEDPSGEDHWLSFSATPIRGENREIDCVLTVTEEITSLKDRAKGLASERDEIASELERVFERVDDAFIGLDDDLRCTYVNERALELFDRTEAETLGENIQKLFPASVDTPVIDSLNEALETQAPTSYGRYCESLGRWMEVHVYPSESGLSVYFRDVSERREQERELATYEILLEESKDVNFILDEAGRFEYLTPSVSNVLGYDREELIGAESFEYVHPEDRDRVTAEFDRMLENPEYEPTIEYRFAHADGSWVVCEALGRNLFDDPTIGGAVAYARDVTERKERQQSLEDRTTTLRSAYEVIVDADRSLSRKIDELLGIVREFVGTDYATLSNVNGDRYTFEAIDVAPGASIEASGAVPLEDRPNCREVVESRERLVLEDVEGEAPELAEPTWSISTYLGAPVLVDGEVYGTFCFYDRNGRVTEYSDWEVTLVELFANWIGQQLERRRYVDQLAALNDLNGIVRQINDAVIEQSTREEIEQTVCNHLASAESYRFAWIGTIDGQSEEFSMLTEAGASDFLEESTIAADPDEGHWAGPTGRALRTGEIATVQDTEDERWREIGREHGFRSAAAVPITYDERTYGVLNVYAERPNAFDDDERSVIAQLGDLVGHAIAAVERKRALMGDEVVEIEVLFPDVIDSDVAPDGRIELTEAIPLKGDDFLVYGSASPEAHDEFDTLVEATKYVEDATVEEATDSGEYSFEARLSKPPAMSIIASLGGSLEEAVLEDGNYRMRFHLSPGVDPRTVIEALEETYPDLDVLCQRQITRPDDSLASDSCVIEEELTDRQRAALKAAFHAGFFDWPREASGEMVADALDVAPPTFHQHLRKAERKVFDSLL